MAFYDDVLDDGVLPFFWNHPTDAVTYEVQFSGRPAATHVTIDWWDVEVRMEQI